MSRTIAPRSPARRARNVTLLAVMFGAVLLGGDWRRHRSDAEPPGPGKRPDAPPVARERPEVLLPVEGRTAVTTAEVATFTLREEHGKTLIMVFVGRGTEKKFVEFDKLDRLPNVAPVVAVRPVRMAILAASFPYKAQVEEFRRKLRLRTDGDVLAETSAETVDDQSLAAFRFLGVDVERRRLDRAGNPLHPEEGLDGYVPINIAGMYRPLLFKTAGRTEDEEPALEPVILPGLVMPRLRAGKRDTYPKIESDLPALRATLAKLPKKPKDPMAPARPDREMALPDHCLIRVIDVTVKPGESYQYRIRVRMANPNYGRKDVANPLDALDAELKPRDGGKWFEVPGVVTVPEESR
jgi:hypothetical protein